MFKQLLERIDNLNQLTEKERKILSYIHGRMELHKDCRDKAQYRALYNHLENYVLSVELRYFSRFTK